MIRAATAGDARAIAGIQVRGWHRAYADIVPPARLEEMTVDSREPLWLEYVQGAERDVVVFDLDGQIAGFCVIGPVRYRSPGDAFGELSSLYVDPPAQGAGVGTALHDHGLETLAARGYACACLWAFRDNEHAIAFYGARGWWVEDGSEALADPDWSAPCVRMRRALTDPVPGAS